MFANAAAVRAHDAHRMSLVNHQQRFVFFLHRDELRQIRIVAVHAVNAFDSHQHAAVVVPDFAEQLIERVPIIVGKWPPPGAA
jgi:hypothetical protein